MANEQLLVTASPHIRDKGKTAQIMADVILALLPAAIAGVYYFGYRAGVVMLSSVLFCVLFEIAWQKLTRQAVTVRDLSAVVTGLLLGMNLPSSAPYWMVGVGALFAVVIVKQMFGGLGHNFINPALAARAFLLASWPVQMTRWTPPLTAFGADALSSSTPLAVLGGAEGSLPTLYNLFVGNISGSIGETSAFMLLLGGLYLVVRRVIKCWIPVSFILTTWLFTTVFGANGWFTGNGLAHILSGGLMLGAIFMATDYTTSPITRRGQIIMGIGCGLIASVIRLYGGYPEGVSYAILLMNVAVPMIDKFTLPKVYGGKR